MHTTYGHTVAVILDERNVTRIHITNVFECITLHTDPTYKRKNICKTNFCMKYYHMTTSRENSSKNNLRVNQRRCHNWSLLFSRPN